MDVQHGTNESLVYFWHCSVCVWFYGWLFGTNVVDV